MIVAPRSLPTSRQDEKSSTTVYGLEREQAYRESDLLGGPSVETQSQQAVQIRYTIEQQRQTLLYRLMAAHSNLWSDGFQAAFWQVCPIHFNRRPQEIKTRADNRTELQDMAAGALLQIRSRPAERAMLSDGLLVKDGYVRRDFGYSRA